MTKSSKLLIAFIGGLLLSAAGPLRPAFAECMATNLGTPTVVAVSTTMASATTILAPTNLSCADVQIMLNWSGSGTYPNGEYLLLSDSSVGISSNTSSGTFRIPAGQRPSDFLNIGSYKGPLYGVVMGTTSAQGVFVIRKK